MTGRTRSRRFSYADLGIEYPFKRALRLKVRKDVGGSPFRGRQRATCRGAERTLIRVIRPLENTALKHDLQVADRNEALDGRETQIVLADSLSVGTISPGKSLRRISI